MAATDSALQRNVAEVSAASPEYDIHVAGVDRLPSPHKHSAHSCNSSSSSARQIYRPFAIGEDSTCACSMR